MRAGLLVERFESPLKQGDTCTANWTGSPTSNFKSVCRRAWWNGEPEFAVTAIAAARRVNQRVIHANVQFRPDLSPWRSGEAREALDGMKIEEEAAMAKTVKGRLSGLALMQVVNTSVTVPARIEYTIRATGKGSNKLRVRFGRFFHLIWANVHDFELAPGQSRSRTIELNSDDTGTSDGKQDVRFRLSRRALTKAIDWELTWTIT